MPPVSGTTGFVTCRPEAQGGESAMHPTRHFENGDRVEIVSVMAPDCGTRGTLIAPEGIAPLLGLVYLRTDDGAILGFPPGALALVSSDADEAASQPG